MNGSGNKLCEYSYIASTPVVRRWHGVPGFAHVWFRWPHHRVVLHVLSCPFSDTNEWLITPVLMIDVRQGTVEGKERRVCDSASTTTLRSLVFHFSTMQISEKRAVAVIRPVIREACQRCVVSTLTTHTTCCVDVSNDDYKQNVVNSCWKHHDVQIFQPATTDFSYMPRFTSESAENGTVILPPPQPPWGSTPIICWAGDKVSRPSMLTYLQTLATLLALHKSFRVYYFLNSVNQNY